MYHTSTDSSTSPPGSPPLAIPRAMPPPPIPPLPYALHAHLAPKPLVRDWLQDQLVRVTLLSLGDLQRRMWKKFPNETLMVPSERYPAFWTWDRTTDERTVLLEMFGFERRSTGGVLTSRLREISSALKKFDVADKPTTTTFALQSLVIASLAQDADTELSVDAPKSSKKPLACEIEPDVPAFEPIDDPKPNSAIPPTPPPPAESIHALSHPTEQCSATVARGKERRQCTKRSTAGSTFCRYHVGKDNAVAAQISAAID